MSWTNVGRITAIGYNFDYVEIMEDGTAHLRGAEPVEFPLNSTAATQARKLELEVGDHVVIESNRNAYAGRSVGIRLAGVSKRAIQKRLDRIEHALGLSPMEDDE
jgi:hypothetical protein